MKVYGSKLQSFRKIKKISSSKLAEMLGVTRKTMSSWETNKSSPRYAEIKLICKILGIQETDISDIKPNLSNNILHELMGRKVQSNDLKTLNKIIDSKCLSDSNIESIVKLYNNVTKCDKENERLKARLKRYESILKNIDTIIYVKNTDHIYIYVNESFLNIVSSEFSANNIVGLNYRKIFDTYEYQNLYELEKEVMESWESINNHYIIIPNSNGSRKGLVNIIPRFTNGVKKELKEIVVTIKDISEISIAMEQQGRLKESINSIDECVYIRPALSPKNRYIFMSEAVQNIFGYTSQEFYNNPELWYNIILEEDRKKLLIDPINKNIIEGKWEYRIIRKDGKIRWVCNKMFRKIDKNKNDTLFGTVRDITEEKKNIEVISLLEHLINNLDYAVWIIAFNEDWFEYIYVNNGVQNVFNEPKETFYKNPYHLGSLLHPDDKNDVEKWWDRMKEENNTINSKDYRIIRNDGKVCSIEDTHCKMSKFNERMCVMGILKLKKIE